LDKDASVLVSTQFKAEFRARLFQTENPSDNQVLSEATDVVFAPDGDIIISSAMTGSSDIWKINRDGSGRRQLTNDAADEVLPVISPAGERIFFFSNRTGEGHVWRMNADGSNQTQITKKEGGFPLFASPDGRWLYYLSGLQRTLWRVSTDGGEEQLVFNKRNDLFYAFSPDGSQIAFWEKQGEENVLKIVSLADQRTIKTFKLADPKARLAEFKWSPDGKFLAYILAVGESENNILWFQPFDAETPRRIADLGDERVFETSGFAFAPDGKSFAVVQGGWRHDAVLLKGLK
jgi:Tol biopolymer transport system component